MVLQVLRLTVGFGKKTGLSKVDGVVKRCNTSIRHSGLDPESRGYSKLKIPDQIRNDSAGAFYKLVKVVQD